MGDGRELVRTGLFVYASQIDALRSVARETRAPVSELVRRAIDRYITPPHPGVAANSASPGNSPR